MKHELRIAPDLSLPREAITQTFGILAVRGGGKSNLAAVMAEQMFHAGLAFCVVDPVGSWWGLRANADGKSGGLAIPIFGGKHGDVPLERGGGQQIADVVVGERVSCVLDISEFSEGDKNKFLIDFAERLYRTNTDTLHLFLEEADDFIPQRPMHEQARLLRAWENIVRRGRGRGLGITMITQRSAAINKNVLTQIETLFVLRTTSPQDRKAIEAWVEYQGGSDELLESLSSLNTGEAWVWSPHWLKEFKRIKVNRRSTYDSGATPSEKGRRAATLVDIDLDAIGKRMADAIERAKAEDPKELQRRIKELLGKIAVMKPEQIEVEVSVLTDEDRRLLGDLKETVRRAVNGLSDAVEATAINIEKLSQKFTARSNPYPRNAAIPQIPKSSAITKSKGLHMNGEAKISKAERRILTALAQYPDGKTKKQLAVLSGYAVNGGSFNNSIGSLNTKGWLVKSGDTIIISSDGIAVLGEYEVLPTGYDLYLYWMSHSDFGHSHKEILRVLFESNEAMDKEAIASHTMSKDGSPYEASGGSFGNALGKLRTLELIEGRSLISINPLLKSSL